MLRDRVVDGGSVVIEDGCIAAVCDDTADGGTVVDLRGHWLIPGLVDLHCDALEKEVEPRPGVRFPLPFAVANADKRNAAAGITTVYHALSFAQDELGIRDVAVAGDIVRAVHAFRPHGLVDNRTHLRYEITDPAGAPVIAALIEAGEVELVSFMDHSPGQGQYRTIEAYRDYLVKTYHRAPADAERMAREKIATRADAMPRVEALARCARDHGVRLASHDDDDENKLRSMAALGVSVAEFPVTIAAAALARSVGIATVFGAPNVVRGGSQSGAVKAADAVMAGVADCLCADYAPAAMLSAVFRLPEVCGISLSDAVAMASANPARSVGLADRGRIEAGCRADLVAVREIAGCPQATATWYGGRLVHRADYRTAFG